MTEQMAIRQSKFSFEKMMLDAHIEDCRDRIEFEENDAKTGDKKRAERCAVRIRILKTVIQALEEIQQIKETIKDFALDCGGTVSDVKEMYRQLNKYLKIGTVEELQALKEKSEKGLLLPAPLDGVEQFTIDGKTWWVRKEFT